MIDLHCHMLPGIDDGARDLDMALEMARISLDDGITLTACTPHIYPGLYQNDAATIRHAVDVFRRQLGEADIALQVTDGADIQVVPELTERLEAGIFPTLSASRYFLFEPPHHALPPRFTESIFQVLACGLVPVITHPERVTWLDAEHYHWFGEAVKQGAWLQVTAGSLTGRFGKRARYWGQRMLEDGLVHILATDAHSIGQRPPLLREGGDEAAKWVGAEEAERLVNERPRGIIDNAEPADLPLVPFLIGSGGDKNSPISRKSWFTRMFSPRESKDRNAAAARYTSDSRSRQHPGRH
jgi:protein-tyrosine phosphatase